jgi:hypothetical protein
VASVGDPAATRVSPRGHVVVESVEVERRRDRLQVGRLDLAQEAEEVLERLGNVRVAAEQHGVGVDAVVHDVEQLGGERVVFAVARRLHRGVDVRDADRPGDGCGPQCLDRESVPEKLVVGGRQRVEEQRRAGRVHAERVAVEGDGRRLVHRHPAAHAVAERLPREERVLGEPGGGVTREPAAGVLQCLGGVPVEERGHRRDAVRQQLVEEAVVEGDGGSAQLPAAAGLQARPAEGEAVGVDAELAHKPHVLGVAVVVVGADRRVRAVRDASGLSHERVPRGGFAAVVEDRPLDLERARGDPHREAGGHQLAETRGVVEPLAAGPGAVRSTHAPSTRSR